jgi:hypothetical protein
VLLDRREAKVLLEQLVSAVVLEQLEVLERQVLLVR